MKMNEYGPQRWTTSTEAAWTNAYGKQRSMMKMDYGYEQQRWTLKMDHKDG